MVSGRAMNFGSRMCYLNQDKGMFASLISWSAYLGSRPSESCLPCITHSSYKPEPEWFVRRRNPSDITVVLSKVKRRH